MRYSNESKQKSNGIVYTPKEMADYLADEMIRYSKIDWAAKKTVTVLDPAAGGGELLVSIVQKISETAPHVQLSVIGYETDKDAAKATERRMIQRYPDISVEIRPKDFLEEADGISEQYDFIIANPPYIRTQILGSDRAQTVAKKMGLSGRIDIYYAFLLYIKNLLSDDGVSGCITSNKFLTIKAGSAVRSFMVDNYRLHSIVDFGDTKLFAASVLPCIVVFSKGKTTDSAEVSFTSVYETKEVKNAENCLSIFHHIHDNGFYRLESGRTFKFQQGKLENACRGALWIISSDEKTQWLKQVQSNTWLHFSDIGKIRVGIKTTADSVFIGGDWSGEKAELELLRPLITHRDAGQIISKHSAGWKVLYTHTVENGKRVAFDIEQYPKTKAYLESHYEQLSGRKYIQKAHRNWYEIWVPQDPASWADRKIVFRDISEKPEFWLDESGAVVNGDCYWIDIHDSVPEETVYLALAVANSRFIEKYYDAKFNTKLYSGKRRYMSQYVELFPIPPSTGKYAQQAIKIVRKMIAEGAGQDTSRYRKRLDSIVDAMFIAD